MAAGDLNIKLGIDTKDAVSDLNNFFSTYSQNAGKAARDLDAALGGKVEKEIVISIKDDKPLAKLEISAEQVSRKLGTLGQALEGSFAGTTKVLKRQISLLEDLQENTRKFSRKTGEVTPEWRKLESAIAAAKNKLATFDSKAIAKVKEEASQAAARLGKLGQALEGGLANTPRILNEQLSLLQNLQQDTAKFSRSTGEVTAEWKKVADAIAAAKAKLASFSDKPLPKPEPPKKDTGGPDRGKLQQAMSGSFANTTKVLKEQIALLEKLKESTAKFNRKTGEVTEEWKKLNKIIGQAKDKLAKFGPGPLEQLKNSLQGVIGKFIAVQTLSNLATGALQALGAAIVNVFQSGMKMELLSLQLETFTGGAQQAEAAMAKFIDIAVKTPFNIEQVAEAAKILMAYGIEANSAVEATERLAIAGSTSGAQLDNLSRNLGQIQAQGRAYTRDLTQFAIQGIPIWDALSQVTGKTT
ncbi:MAG: tape measure protein, partial [Candidatus Nanopelagicaceae bacterium]